MTATTIAARLHPELIALRREIHGDPELGNHLPRTQARVLAALSGLNLEITTGEALTSVVAVLRGRGESAGPDAVGGAGLGLSISKWAVEAHGGHLTLEGSNSVGSTFRITLPRAVAPAATRPTHAA